MKQVRASIPAQDATRRAGSQTHARGRGMRLVLICCLAVMAGVPGGDSLATRERPGGALSQGAPDIPMAEIGPEVTYFEAEAIVIGAPEAAPTIPVVAAQPIATYQSSAGDTSWELILVNQWHPIPEGLSVTLTELSNGHSVDSRIYPSLQAMFDDARAEGIYPVVVSGFRTAEKQQSLLDEKFAAYRAEGLTVQDARAKAEAWVAVPGTSEHELGIAVDINADGVNSAGHEVYGWLADNAYRYGFIRRYPPNKTDITGVIHEPWHYRYVGTEAALEIWRQGICLEEYLGMD